MLKQISLLFILFFSLQLNAQDDILYYEQGFWGSKFIQNGKTLDDFELKTLLYNNTEAYQTYKKGVGQNNLSIGLMTTGSILVVSSLFTEDAETKLALSGSGLIIDLIALIPAFGAQKKIRESTYIFNRKNKETGFKIETTKYGLGLVYVFN